MSSTIAASSQLRGAQAAIRRAAARANYGPYVMPSSLPDEAFRPLVFLKPDHAAFPWHALGTYKGVAALSLCPCHFINDDDTLASPKIVTRSVGIPYRTVYYLATVMEEPTESAKAVLSYIYGYTINTQEDAPQQQRVPEHSMKFPEKEAFVGAVQRFARISIYEYSVTTSDMFYGGMHTPSLGSFGRKRKLMDSEEGNHLFYQAPPYPPTYSPTNDYPFIKPEP
eukprot:gene559-833_t